MASVIATNVFWNRSKVFVPCPSRAASSLTNDTTEKLATKSTSSSTARRCAALGVFLKSFPNLVCMSRSSDARNVSNLRSETKSGVDILPGMNAED